MGNCCDNFSLQCIEFSLLIKNSTNLLITILAMIILNWEHAGYKGLILYIFILILLIINEIFVILISCWRKKILKLKFITRVINFGFIGLVFSICLLIIFCVTAIVIKFNFHDKDYPCKSFKNTSFSFFRILNAINDEQKMDDICDNLDKNYYTNTIKHIEYIILYLNTTIVEILSIINICLWSNFLKKVKILNESSNEEKNIPYIIKNQNKKIQYPFKTNTFFRKGAHIRQVNFVQNNYKNIYNSRNKQSLQSINKTTNFSESKYIGSQKDKSEEILYSKPISYNSLKMIIKQ